MTEVEKQEFDGQNVVSEDCTSIDSLRPKTPEGQESFDRDIKEWGKLQKIIESAQESQNRLITNISNECNETENLTKSRYKGKLVLILSEFTDGKVSKMMSTAEVNMAKADDAMNEFNMIASLIDPDYEVDDGAVKEEDDESEEFTEFD